MKLKSERFCPKCGSENWAGNVAGNLIAGETNPNILTCKDCGYEGTFPSAKIHKIKNIQNKIKEINKERKKDG